MDHGYGDINAALSAPREGKADSEGLFTSKTCKPEVSKLYKRKVSMNDVNLEQQRCLLPPNLHSSRVGR